MYFSVFSFLFEGRSCYFEAGILGYLTVGWYVQSCDLENLNFLPIILKEKMAVSSTNLTEKYTADLHTNLPKMKERSVDNFYAT